jgi:hypothetical protein
MIAVDQDSGFHVFALDHPAAARTHRAKLAKLKEDQVKQLLSPGIVKSWEDYKQRIGRLQGLDDALNLLSEAEQEDNNRGSKNARRSP